MIAAVCSVFREEESLRRFIGMCAWSLRTICLILFIATIRLHEQAIQLEIEMRERRENPVEDVLPPRRHRRVAYRHLTRAPAEDREDPRDD